MGVRAPKQRGFPSKFSKKSAQNELFHLFFYKLSVFTVFCERSGTQFDQSKKMFKKIQTRPFFFFFYLPPACSVQDQPWGRGRCHPFCRSRSHLEEADDTGTPPAVTEAGFERMTLVLREMCLTQLTTTALNPPPPSHRENPRSAP